MSKERSCSSSALVKGKRETVCGDCGAEGPSDVFQTPLHPPTPATVAHSRGCHIHTGLVLFGDLKLILKQPLTHSEPYSWWSFEVPCNEWDPARLRGSAPSPCPDLIIAHSLMPLPGPVWATSTGPNDQLYILFSVTQHFYINICENPIPFLK